MEYRYPSFLFPAHTQGRDAVSPGVRLAQGLLSVAEEAPAVGAPIGLLNQASEYADTGEVSPLGLLGAAIPLLPSARLLKLLPNENMTRGREAVEQVLRDRASVSEAMHRDDVGPITFDYGDGRTGLSHIIQRRNAEGLDGDAFVRENLPDILANGRLQMMQGAHNNRRAHITHQGQRVILSLQRRGGRETWVITGFVDD